MAIIYSYPLKSTPTMADLLVISDKETNDPKNQTKNVTIQSIVDLIPYIYAENAWNTISFPGVPGAPADVQAFGVNQTLNLTTGSLVITTIPSAGPGLPSTINIESPPGDGNIADRNLTFDNNWQSDLNGFTWDLKDDSGIVTENVMHFENNLIGVGGGSSVWDIPIHANNLGDNNIYLGGDGGVGLSNHEFGNFMISIGKYALENAGTLDYVAAGGTNNNNECTAIGYQSQKEFGTAALPGAGLLDQLGQNVSVGYNSLKDNTGNIDGTNLGSFNVAIGGRSLEAANGATANMSIGHNSALALTTGFGNVLSGHEVGLDHFANGYPTQISLTDGSNNVISGYISNTENGNKDVIIGSNASVGVGIDSGGADTSANNTILIGTDSFIPASEAIIIGNDNWYDITGGSIAPNLAGFAGPLNEQLLSIGHSVWYASAVGGVALPASTFTTQVGSFQSILGSAITSIGYGNNVGFDISGASTIQSQLVSATPPGSQPNLDSVLVGDFVESYGIDNVTIGTESITGLTGIHSPDPGPGNRAIEKSVTIGRQAVSEQPNSVVIGFNADATDAAGIAYTGGCVAIGSGAQAQNNNTMSIGLFATSGAENSIAIGNNTQVDISGGQSIAIGHSAQVIGVESAIHIGTLAGAAIGTGVNAIGIGRSVDAVGDNSIAIGAVATAVAANQVILGYGAGAGITLPDVFAVAETGFYTVNLVGRTQSGVAGNNSLITVAGSLNISGGIDPTKPYLGSELTLQYSQTRFTGQTIIADSEIVNGGAAFSIDLNAGDIYTIFGNDQANITLDYPTNIGPGTTIIKFKQGAVTPSTLVLNNAPCAPTPCGEWKFSGGGAPIGLTFAVNAEDILTIVKIYNTAIGGYDLYCSMLNDFQP